AEVLRQLDEANKYRDIIIDVMPRITQDVADDMSLRIRDYVAAQLAERDAEIAALRAQVADAERQWDNVRHDNAKLLRELTENRRAYSQLYDDMEDVKRRNAELQVWKDAVPVVGIKRLFRDAPYDASYADEVWQWIEKYT